LLIDKGLIRIGLSIPTTSEFEVTTVEDPNGCNTSPATGIVNKTTVGLPAPVADNECRFLDRDHVGWPRAFPGEPGRRCHAGHAQATAPPTPDQVAEIVAFQKGIFTAQILDHKAKFLSGDNAKGGPTALSLQEFFIGINDPLGGNPKGIGFTSQIFDLYRPWLSAGERHEHEGPIKINIRPQRQAQHRRLLRHLPRLAEYRQSLGQVAHRYRHSRCRR
jgi:cytochrome c peroxidase